MMPPIYPLRDFIYPSREEYMVPYSPPSLLATVSLLHTDGKCFGVLVQAVGPLCVLWGRRAGGGVHQKDFLLAHSELMVVCKNTQTHTHTHTHTHTDFDYSKVKGFGLRVSGFGFRISGSGLGPHESICPRS